MRQLRKILFPFSVIYHGITMLRNWGYDQGILRSKAYDFPVVVVGNLSTGGTGKSPMAEYLIRLFQDDYAVATLSRGYGRKTRGYIKVGSHMRSQEVGDEPLQFARKFDKVAVAVCENRQEGVSRLMKETPEPELIILDDAFQHRKVKAGYYILLTAYDALYSDDLILPAGNLRESRRGAQRAQSIVVTKCPGELSPTEQSSIWKKLDPKPGQSVFFTSITYSNVIVSTDEQMPLQKLSDIPFALVTGIANPKPLLQFLDKQGLKYRHYKFGDHHDFALSEIKMLQQQKLILTTEKDYMRLQGKLDQTELYYLPIKVSVQNNEQFDTMLKTFVAQTTS